MLVVDAQVHVWQKDTPDRPWIASFPEPFVVRRDEFLGGDLLKEMNTAGVNKAILVPTNFAGAVVEVSLEEAEKYPGSFYVVPRLVPSTTEAEVDAFAQHPYVVGCRTVFHSPEQQADLARGALDWVWPMLERKSIPMFIVVPRDDDNRLDLVATIARDHPDLRIVIDHFGVPTGVHDADFDGFIDSLLPLAELPNVAVKVSCAPKFSTEKYPFPSLQPQIRRVIEAFGPQRSFWGSDMTACPATYEQCVTLFTEELDFLSPEDLETIMGRGLCEWIQAPYIYESRPQATGR